MSDPFNGVPTLELEIPKTLWLTSNQRLHHHAKAHATKWLRQLARQTAKARGLKLEPPVQVYAHIALPTRRRFDPANASPTVKACLDGVVDARIGLADDDHEHVTAVTFVRHVDPDRQPHRSRKDTYLVTLRFVESAHPAYTPF